jgi:hypothetical protein
MPIILAILNFLASQIGTILGLTQQLQSNTAHGAQEATPYRIDIQVQNIANDTTNLTWGLPALHAQIAAIAASIATRQSGSSAVMLPVTAPAGYGLGGGTLLNASDVWGFLLSPGARAAGDLLVQAGWFGLNTSIAGVPFPVATSSYFVQYGSWSGSANPEGPTHGPIFPILNILLTDTLHVFLERESFYSGWTARGDGTWVVAMGDGDFYYATTITDAEFLVLRDGGAAAPPVHVPPVWPGVANVTIGTPVSMSDGLTVTGPLHGVIVAITSVAYPSSYYPFGTLKSFSRIGGIVFVDDNGQADYAQPIALENGVICPRTMVRADHAILRLQSGVVGTITPWTSP